MLKRNNINLNFILIILGFIFEASVFTFYRNEYHYYRLPIIGIVGGLITSLGIYLESRETVSEPYQLEAQFNQYNLIVTLICSLLISYFFLNVCFKHPINPYNSDVIPTIQTMVKRVLNFEDPNKLIFFDGYSFEPAYLTMQYLPFCIAEKLNIDYRFFAYIIFTISIIFISKLLQNNVVYSLESIFKITTPFIFLYQMIIHFEGIIMHSIELMDAAFVVFLAYSIFSKSIFTRAVAIILCLLSRYGIVMWFPISAFYLYKFEGLNEMKRVSFFVILGVLLLYVFPFMMRNPMVFFNGINSYNNVALNIWENVPDWYSVKRPYTLTQGFGFAIFFNDFLNMPTLQKINLIKTVQIISCFVFIILTIKMMISSNIINKKMFLLYSLKMYLVIFYSFLYVPFSYLYLVPLLTTLPTIFIVKVFKEK